MTISSSEIPDETFHHLIRLQGSMIEVRLRSSGEKLKGKLVNTMFDSFLIDSNGKRRVIRFEDIDYCDIPMGGELTPEKNTGA